MKDLHKDYACNLWFRTFKSDTIYKDILLYFTEQYFNDAFITQETLIDRVLASKNLIECFYKRRKTTSTPANDISDSLKTIWNNYHKQLYTNSYHQKIVYLLTKSF